MKQDDFVTISDIHVKSNKDPKYQILLNFFSNPIVEKTNYIFLLGDIFDILVGSYKEYVFEYKKFFEILNENLSKGKKIYWIEGNHDFHFYNVLKQALSKNNLVKMNYCKNPITLLKNKKKYYLSHGDELDYKNPNYLKYRQFMRSHFAQTVIDYFIGYEKAMSLKEKMSQTSRRSQANFDEQKSRDKFREYARYLQGEGYDFVITGHSHILDDYNGYTNNGYFPNTNQFIHDDGVKRNFIPLT